MFNPRADLSNSEGVWTQTFLAVKALWKQALAVCLFGVLIPIVGFYTYGWVEAIRLANRLVQSMASPSSADFEKTLEYLASYIGKWSVSGVAFICWLEVGILILITMTYSFCNSNAPSSLRSHILQAIKVLPKFFMALILIGVILIMSQTFFLFFLALSTMLLMVPIILVEEKCGVLRAISNSLTLSYAGPNRGKRIYVFFQLISSGMIFLFIPIMIIQLKDFLLHFDDFAQLPRNLWISHFPDFQISSILFFADILASLLLWISVSLFTVIMTAFYCQVRDGSDIKKPPYFLVKL